MCRTLRVTSHVFVIFIHQDPVSVVLELCCNALRSLSLVIFCLSTISFLVFMRYLRAVPRFPATIFSTLPTTPKVVKFAVLVKLV